MFGPNEELGCEGCSIFVDRIGQPAHLNAWDMRAVSPFQGCPHSRDVARCLLLRLLEHLARLTASLALRLYH
jgi:hypothetical protein